MEGHVTAVTLLVGKKENGRHLGVMKEHVMQGKTTLSAKIKLMVMPLVMKLGVGMNQETLVVLRIQVMQCLSLLSITV